MLLKAIQAVCLVGNTCLAAALYKFLVRCRRCSKWASAVSLGHSLLLLMQKNIRRVSTSVCQEQQQRVFRMLGNVVEMPMKHGCMDVLS